MPDSGCIAHMHASTDMIGCFTTTYVRVKRQPGTKTMPIPQVHLLPGSPGLFTSNLLRSLHSVLLPLTANKIGITEQSLRNHPSSQKQPPALLSTQFPCPEQSTPVHRFSAVEGVPVGRSVGTAVGEGVVGVIVGISVGETVGIPVGNGVGVSVGTCVGTSVGLTVDGTPVGASVGTAVGAPVGAKVGTADGVKVGSSVGEPDG